MNFRYRAYSADKRIISGTLESASPEAAEASLYKAGFRRILRLQKTSSNLDLDKLFASAPRISKEALLDFTNEIATLTESGLTLLAALKQLEKQSKNAALKGVLVHLTADLKGGKPFFQALSAYPQIFSETYCSIMEANEKAGTLDTGLRQIARQLKQQITTKSQVQRSLTQPLIIVGLAIGVVILLSLVVMPPLVDVFRQFGTQLPWTTRLLIGFADIIKNYKWGILIGLAVLVAAIIFFMKRSDTKPFIDRLMLKIPLIGQVMLWNITAQFSRTLGNLLGAGILLPDSINIMLHGISNIGYRDSVSLVRKQVIQGQSLSAAMGQDRNFLPLLVEMVGVGEASGNLEEALGTVADYYEVRVEKRIARLTSLLEPLLLIAVGLVVGFVAVSMISTIYGLIGNFK
jgi:type IV pilus assembly protein PilC